MLAAICKLRAQFQNWNHNLPNCDSNLEIVRTIPGFCAQFENCGDNLWIFAAILKLWAHFRYSAHNSKIVDAISELRSQYRDFGQNPRVAIKRDIFLGIFDPYPATAWQPAHLAGRFRAQPAADCKIFNLRPDHKAANILSSACNLITSSCEPLSACQKSLISCPVNPNF